MDKSECSISNVQQRKRYGKRTAVFWVDSEWILSERSIEEDIDRNPIG